MASIWMERPAQLPRKLMGHLDPVAATFMLRKMEVDWLAHPGRKVFRYDGLQSLLYDANGQLFGMLYLEPMSPPTAPGPGETRRPASAGAK